MTTSNESEDPHFKRHIAELGDHLDVVANQDVFSQSGIKLLASGTKINSSLYQRILQHKMMPQLEQALSVDKAVTNADLVACAQELTAAPSLYERMQQSLPATQSLLAVLGKISLHPALAFKLTVAREELPDLFRHSVAAALSCAFLGFRLKLDAAQVVQLATAGLFHDLGELHIDPAILDRSKQLGEGDLKHIYAHPVTISMMVRQFPEYPPVIASAILEHHERLDGSGYPQGLRQISPMGRLLAVAEVASSLYRSLGEKNLARIDTTLKLSMRYQMDEQAISSLLAVLHPADGSGKAGRKVDIERLRRSLRNLADTFVYWDSTMVPGLTPYSEREAVFFLITQIAMLKKIIECAGFHYEQIDQFIDVLEADSQEASELQNMAQEFAWRVNDILHEFERRWPTNGHSDLPLQLVEDWTAQVEKVTAA